MLRPDIMPTFANGIKLTATDLNAMSNAQVFLNNGHWSLNFPIEYLQAERDVTFLHRYRYLHWAVSATTSAKLYINGVNAGAVAQSATSGAVNLGNGYDGFTSNPYSLSLHQPYKVKWIDGAVDCKRIYEHVSSSGNLSLPAGVPTFSGIVSANALNNVATNCQYLIDAALDCPVPVAITRTYVPAVDDRRYFAAYRKHDYLYFKGRYVPNASPGTINGIVIRVNGTQIYTASLNGNATASFDFVFGYNGGPQQNFGGTGVLSSANVNPSGWYEIEIKVGNEEGLFNATFYHNLLCETPFNAQL